MARFSSSVVAAAANVGGQSPRRGRFWHPGSYKICSSFFPETCDASNQPSRYGMWAWGNQLVKSTLILNLLPRTYQPQKTNISYLFIFQFSQTGGLKNWFLDRKSWHLRDDLLLSIDTRDSPPPCFLVSKAYDSWRYLASILVLFWLVVSNMNFLGKLFPTYLAFMIFHGTSCHRTCFCTATAGSFHWRHRSRCWEWPLFREKTVWRWCWHLHDVTIGLLPII